MKLNFIDKFLNKFHFMKVVITRFFTILFRRRKGIELLFLDYADEHIFEKSYLVINYRFRNAIYYKFGNLKTLEKQIKIFDLKNFENDFDITVYGFFQKKKYKIKVEPKLMLDDTNFKTSLSNLYLKLEEKPFPKLMPVFFSDVKKPIIIDNEIEIKQSKIKISNTTFNQTDFI